MARKQKYYQRKDGLFEAIRTINGKRVAFRGHSCQEVEQKMLAYHEERKRGRKFPVLADEWEREHEKKVKEATRIAYKSCVKRLKAAFPGPATQIKPLDVDRYLEGFEKQGYAAQTVRVELSILRMILSHAVMAGDIDVNPAAEITISKGLPKKTREALTEEQEKVVKTEWANAEFGLFALFLLYTGMRRGEALAISYKDIDRKKGVVRVNKKLSYAGRNKPVMEDWTKSENGIREVPLLAPLAAALPKGRIGLVFPGADGGYMTDYAFYRNWRAFCKDVGFVEKTPDGEISFPITPHCFRHSFATICYEAGLDPRQAAKICGNTPETLEKVYTHLRQGKEASAAEKLAAFIALAE